MSLPGERLGLGCFAPPAVARRDMTEPSVITPNGSFVMCFDKQLPGHAGHQSHRHQLHRRLAPWQLSPLRGTRVLRSGNVVDLKRAVEVRS